MVVLYCSQPLMHRVIFWRSFRRRRWNRLEVLTSLCIIPGVGRVGCDAEVCRRRMCLKSSYSLDLCAKKVFLKQCQSCSLCIQMKLLRFRRCRSVLIRTRFGKIPSALKEPLLQGTKTLSASL